MTLKERQLKNEIAQFTEERSSFDNEIQNYIHKERQFKQENSDLRLQL